MKGRVVLLMGLLLLLVPSMAHGVMFISVGNWTVAPNTAGQTHDLITGAPFQIFASGPDVLGGARIRNYINGGVIGGPTIDGINAGGAAVAGHPTAVPGSAHLFGAPGGFGGSINSAPDGVFPGSSGLSTSGLTPIFFLGGTSNPTATSPLMSFTFDSTGYVAGVYSWSLSNPALGANAATLFFTPAGDPIETTLISGAFTIIPEPSTLALAAFGFAALATWGWRRKR